MKSEKEKIEALEAEIDALPIGYISRKNINGPRTEKRRASIWTIRRRSN